MNRRMRCQFELNEFFHEKKPWKLQKRIMFHNVDEWYLLSKVYRAVDHTTKSHVKHSNIDQFFCVEQGRNEETISMTRKMLTVLY